MPAPRRNKKRLGDLTEALFLQLALGLGYTVSKPFGDNAPFDFIVGASSLKRVQVKGCYAAPRFEPRGAYRVSAHGCRATYSPDEIDLIAAYVWREKVWYIVPISVLCGAKSLDVYPHIPAQDRRYGRYREAWWRLGKAVPPLPHGPHPGTEVWPRKREQITQVTKAFFKNGSYQRMA